MAFSKAQVHQQLSEGIHDIFAFRKADILIYRGTTSDSGQLYNELAARFVYDHLEQFKAIRPHYRKDSYRTNKYKQYSRDQSNLETPKQLSLKLYQQRKFGVGRIIDAEMPIFNDFQHKYLGKVPNILHSKQDEVFLLNVKLASTQQSLLRYIVECLVMYRTVDHKKILKDFVLPNHSNVKFAPVLFKGSSPYLELYENRPELHRLMSVLDLAVFVIESSHLPYKMTRHHFSDFIDPLNHQCLLDREIG